MKVYVVIGRKLDTVTMTSDVGNVYVTSNAEKAIELYHKECGCAIIVTKEMEE